MAFNFNNNFKIHIKSYKTKKILINNTNFNNLKTNLIISNKLNITSNRL